MAVSSPTGHRSEPDPTWVHQQESLADRGPSEREQAVRALMGACLLGALDHVGAADLRRWEIADRRGVTLAQLSRVFLRRDSGLHGCGFEYAVDAAINGSLAIPAAVRDTILTATSGQVQLILQALGVPTDGWNSGLRSVMYGVERRARPERMAALETALGKQALLWPCSGADPVRLLDVLPLARCPGPIRRPNRNIASDRPQLPDNLSRLWKTDLLLGGARVLPTEQVQAVLAGPPFAPTAWVSASLKYHSGLLEAGPGLHLGIETAFKGAGRRPRTALFRELSGMPVITLPLDGDFVRAFHRANASLALVIKAGLGRHLHPAYAPDRRIEQYGSWFGARRSQPVVDIAEELLGVDPTLFTIAGRPSASAADAIAERRPVRGSRRRPLAPVPQSLAG